MNTQLLNAITAHSKNLPENLLKDVLSFIELMEAKAKYQSNIDPINSNQQADSIREKTMQLAGSWLDMDNFDEFSEELTQRRKQAFEFRRVHDIAGND